MFMMPSRFEPCGLNQMYSFQYGTVPIVRETGGLADTPSSTPPTRPSPMKRPTVSAFGRIREWPLGETLWRACQVYEQPERWEPTDRQPGMRQDWSWTRSARQ